LAAIAAAAVTGCGGGGEHYRATGKVAYANKEPLKAGMVSFRLAGSSPPLIARGILEPDGRFELVVDPSRPGVPLGDYEVIVTPDIPEKRGTMTAAEFERASRPIDSKFRSYDSSGLRFKVTPDESQNVFTIEVTRPRT